MNFKLVDINEEFCFYAKEAFRSFPKDQVQVVQGSVEDETDYDCLVVPSNNIALPAGNFDHVVMKIFKDDVYAEAQQIIQREYHGEQPIGSCVIVNTKHPKHPYLAFSPTYPHQPDAAYLALSAALKAIKEHNDNLHRSRVGSTRINRVVCIGMGTYTGNMHSEKAAQQMARACSEELKG